jgi:hypothetical protein
VIPHGQSCHFVDDAVLLLLLTISIPFVLLGTPLALVIRFVIEILRTVF